MEADETLGKGRPGNILAGFLVRLLGFESRLTVAGNQGAGIVGAEEGLAGSVGVRSESWIARGGIVLAVVKNDDAISSEERRWADLREATVEVTWPFAKDDFWMTRGVFDGRPTVQVWRGGEMNFALTPVHPEAAFDLCGDETPVSEFGDDSAGFVSQMVVFAAMRAEEGGALLGPVKHVG